MEPLATVDKDLNPIPWLATAWTPNATFDSYTITLRDNVTFQDGEKFDAAAVKLNIDDALTAALTSTAISYLFEGVSVVDPLTVKVDLTQPWAAFPNTFLAGRTYLIMAPQMLTSPDRGAAHPIGTGPYTFASWTKDDTFKTTKNPNYWQPGKPHLDALDFKVLSDPSTQKAAIQSGDVEMVYTADYQTATSLEGDYTVIKDWQSTPGMAMVNTAADVGGTPNPLSNLHARLALAYGTDQQALANTIGSGVLLPKSPIPSSTKWGMPDDQTGYPGFDLDKAKEQVDLYKQDTGSSSLSIELSSSSDAGTVAEAQTLQAQWGEAGIDTKIATKEASSFISDVVFGKYEVGLFSMYGGGDPDYNYYFWTAANINPFGAISINFTRFTTPEMEQSINAGRRSPDFATRKAAYDDVVRQINAAAVNIWTVYAPSSLVAKKDLHGLATPSQISFTVAPSIWLGDLWVSR